LNGYIKIHSVIIILKLIKENIIFGSSTIASRMD
jgi:hypothetical protein